MQACTCEETPEALSSAIFHRRQLVRVRAMHGTVYFVPRDLVPYALELTPLNPVTYCAKLAGIRLHDYAPLADRIEEIVAQKLQTAAEIRKTLGAKAPTSSGLS